MKNPEAGAEELISNPQGYFSHVPADIFKEMMLWIPPKNSNWFWIQLVCKAWNHASIAIHKAHLYPSLWKKDDFELRERTNLVHSCRNCNIVVDKKYHGMYNVVRADPGNVVKFCVHFKYHLCAAHLGSCVVASGISHSFAGIFWRWCLEYYVAKQEAHASTLLETADEGYFIIDFGLVLERSRKRDRDDLGPFGDTFITFFNERGEAIQLAGRTQLELSTWTSISLFL